MTFMHPPLRQGFLIALGLSLSASSVLAAAPASKQALAETLAQIQVESDGGAVEQQLIASALQPLMAHWTQQIGETVPEAQREAVSTQLDGELQKTQTQLQKLITPQVSKAAKTALAPVFAAKLSQQDLQTIVTFMQSPARQHLQALAGDASDAWFRSVIDATRAQVETDTRALDARAQKIISAAAANTGK